VKSENSHHTEGASSRSISEQEGGELLNWDLVPLLF
jgi:hypothetical protein